MWALREVLWEVDGLQDGGHMVRPMASLVHVMCVNVQSKGKRTWLNTSRQDISANLCNMCEPMNFFLAESHQELMYLYILRRSMITR